MITARPLVLTDLAAVVDLMHAYDRRWFGEPVLTADDVAAEWASPDFDLATDTEGWVEGQQLVAFGTLGTRGAVELAVAESWAGAGLEDSLLGRWEAEGRRRAFGRLHRHLPAADARGRELLEGRGWRADRIGWLLRLAPDCPVALGTLPEGYAVRPMTESDLPAAYAVLREAFASWSPVTRPYADWRAGLIDRPDLAVTHCRVVVHSNEHGDEVVGACLVFDPPPGVGPEPEAFVPQLGVLPGHRRQGLARELLASTTLGARARGVTALALYTHADTGALGLYQRFGMVVRHDLVEYALDLATPDPRYP